MRKNISFALLLVALVGFVSGCLFVPIATAPPNLQTAEQTFLVGMSGNVIIRNTGGDALTCVSGGPVNDLTPIADVSVNFGAVDGTCVVNVQNVRRNVGDADSTVFTVSGSNSAGSSQTTVTIRVQ